MTLGTHRSAKYKSQENNFDFVANRNRNIFLYDNAVVVPAKFVYFNFLVINRIK